MKRAWKIALGVVGIPALCVVVLWVDSYYRAVAAIRAEDDRLARDIAAFRAGMKPGLPVSREQFLPRLPGDSSGVEKKHPNLPCPMSLFLSPERAHVDLGRSDHQTFALQLIKAYYLEDTSDEIEPYLRGDQVIRALSVTAELGRECGYSMSDLIYGFEARALHSLRRTLEGNPPPEELRSLAENLDRCFASRPAEYLDAEYLMDRAEVLNVLHKRDDPTGFIRRPPGWREFFSWRIHLVKCLRELEEDFFRARTLTIPEVEGLQPRLDAEAGTRRTRSSVLTRLAEHAHLAHELTCMWNLARTAVAVARYRADLGRLPDRLEELPPEYLMEMLRDPWTGEAPRLEDGRLRIRVSAQLDLDWDLRPK